MLVGVNSFVRYLNKLTWPRAKKKKISLQMGRLITVQWSPAKEADPHIQRLANVGMAPMP